MFKLVKKGKSFAIVNNNDESENCGVIYASNENGTQQFYLDAQILACNQLRLVEFFANAKFDTIKIHYEFPVSLYLQEVMVE